MEIRAKLSYLRIAPRKVRLVADVIRGKRTGEALTKLSFLPKRGVLPVLKLLKQAIANAKNNFHLDENNLYIKKIIVDEGPKLKRWRPRARGVAYPIQKKSSHITIILEEIEKKAKKKKGEKEGKLEEKKEKIPEKTIEAPKSPEEVIKETKRPPKFRPSFEIKKPKIEKGARKIFRRKAIG